MTIAGLDPSGGAGIVADIRTFSAFGCFAAAVVSSVTFQNTVGVFGSIAQSPESVRGQAVPVIEDIGVTALKTGMLPTAGVIGTTADLITEFGLKHIVVDPVVRSTSGFDLIDDDALHVLVERLFPLADLVTPNIPEAERIARIKIETVSDIERAAEAILNSGAKRVLIKGGHLKGSSAADDHLFSEAGKRIFRGEYIETTATHGTGCTLAAAITANLALGKDIDTAVETAKRFVADAIKNAPLLGHGHSPIGIPTRV